MRLLDVQAVLDREKDIQQAEPETEVLKDGDDSTTSYAILSHRWGAEVSYQEMTKLLKMTERKRDEVRQRDGYQKIIKSCELALKDGYSWLWVDTCCIDKRNSAELSEAINSMYRWYENSQVCYAYLGDVEEPSLPSQRNNSRFSKSKGWPEWFVRGWTLQELVAPKQLEFFNRNWTYIGNKRRLAPTLEKITRIPANILGQGLTSKRLSIAQIMSWAADRQTTRVEDRAYSLMGLFGVSMPMLYGEGEKAFQRLQLEIMRASNDQSIFAWDPYGRMPRYGNVLADDPSYFQDCNNIQKVESDQLINKLTDYVHSHGLSDNEGVSEWRQVAHSQHMLGFVATNAGIQIWFPTIPYRDYPSVFKAILACSDSDGELITIDLASRGSTYDRSFNATEISETYPLFRRLYLSCSLDANETPCHLTLDDRGALYRGFTRRSTFPRDITSDTVILSTQTNDLMVIVYANDDTGSHFAIGFGYHSGQGWVHATCDEHLAPEEGHWSNFGRKMYDVMWNARTQHALRTMPNEPGNDSRSPCDTFVKHAHLPRSIWAARVVWGRWDEGNLKVMVDVEQCPGCCVGPLEWIAASNDRDGLDMPGFMKTLHNSHELKLDSLPVQLDECLGQGIILGDYGDCSSGNFRRLGNIFEDMQALGIDPTDTANCSVVSQVSGDEDVLSYLPKQDGLVVTFHKGGNHLVLYQPIGLSIPNNQHLVLLPKALSTRLANKHLVTTVIQCSDLHRVDGEGVRMDLDGNSALETGGPPSEPGVFTPLCTILSPQVWRREPASTRRREQFKLIREHFYTLANLMFDLSDPSHDPQQRPPEAETGHESTSRRTKHETVKFLSDIFGLENLETYIGKITFFEEFSLMTKTQSRSDASAVIGLSARLARSSWNPFRFRALRIPRPETVVPPLLEKCKAFDQVVESHRRLSAKKIAQNEMKSISKTLSIGLLEHICTVILGAVEDEPRVNQASHSAYARQIDIHFAVQEINALQTKLVTTVNADEQRALEEDVTGKILWLFWCGILSEVDQRLQGVVNYISRERESMTLEDRNHFRQCLHETRKLTSHIYLDDDLAHLRRIMLDARTDVLKHQLWHTACAAEQAKWPSMPILKSTHLTISAHSIGPHPHTFTVQ